MRSVQGSPEIETETSRLGRAPLLGSVAAVAAFLDLGWNRFALRLIDPDARDLWIPLVGPGRFLRNVGAIAGLVAACLALASLVRNPPTSEHPERRGESLAPYRRFMARLSIVAVAGLYLPGVAVSLVLPRERLPNLVVALALLSGNALVALLGSYVIPYRRVGPAWPALMAGITAILAMTGLLVAQLRQVIPGVGALGALARHGGELAWLLTPLVLVLDRDVRARARHHRGHLAVAILAGVVVLSGAVWGQLALGSTSARIAYGAFRLASLPAEATALYGVPLSMSVALAVLHLESPERRQIAWALLLWIAAGLAPRTPSGILYEVVAALLFARAAQSAHPDGRALTRSPSTP